MERETQIVWDFMSNAYNRGVLDAALSLAGGLMPRDVDVGELLAQMEDALVQADMSGFERLFGKTLVPAMEAFSGKNVMSGLRVLMAVMREPAQWLVRASGNDPAMALQKVQAAVSRLGVFKPAAMVLYPAGAFIFKAAGLISKRKRIWPWRSNQI